MLTLEDIRIEMDGFQLTADFAVAQGACVGVIGPSGAGKSTLLGAVAGFIPIASGDIRWQGKSISGLAPADRPISLLFQDNNLFPHLTAEQNVGLGLRPDLRLSSHQKEQVARALDRVGLRGLAARKPAALSGGQQSRVALARMLLRGKPLMLLDEPFSALGPALKAEMLDLVKELVVETGATLLMVTHDPQDAVRIAGETVLVAEGVAYSPVDTQALFADPPQILKDYLGVFPL